MPRPHRYTPNGIPLKRGVPTPVKKPVLPLKPRMSAATSTPGGDISGKFSTAAAGRSKARAKAAGGALDAIGKGIFSVGQSFANLLPGSTQVVDNGNDPYSALGMSRRKEKSRGKPTNFPK